METTPSTQVTLFRGLLLLLLLHATAIQMFAQQPEVDGPSLVEIRAKAESGDAQSQFELAKAFSLGNFGLATNLVEAVNWYRKAAEQNYAPAQNNLGECYAWGQGVADDSAEGLKWYTKAAEQNYAEAQFSLGLLYYAPHFGVLDYAQAVKWFRKAAEQNHAVAQRHLGDCYKVARGVAKDDAEAVNWYRKAAEQNDAQAQRYLGISYDMGQGVSRDAVEAVKWWRKAAEQNDAEAQYNLGLCCTKGQGVTKDLVEAVKWYRKAAEITPRDDQETITKIGIVLIEAGEIEVGTQMLQESAEAGNPLAQLGLANLFESGESIPRNMTQALRWYITVVEKNREGAQLADIRLKIAVIYRDGLAGQKNPREAFKWLLRAAETEDTADVGRAEAMFFLSTVYQDGALIPKNATEARKWLARAAEADNDLAKCFLNQPREWNGIERSIKTNQFTDVLGRLSPTVIRREVRNWILKEANSGNPIAQYCLAIGYLNAAWGYKDRELLLSGDSLSNYKTGTNWLLKAAIQNEPSAQLIVADSFQYGWGVVKDLSSAFKWYESAARQRNAGAMIALATLYRRGKAVPADGRKAFELYVQAAIGLKDQVERIDSVEDKLQLQLPLNKARIALGEMARDGDGVPQNFVEAYAWFNLAAAEGWYPAPQERDRLAKLLQPDQLADAQRRSSEYFSTKTRSGSNSRLEVDDLRASGTGFFISDAGYVISNNHVVEGANQVRLVTSAGLISAKVVKVDAANDLALLKAEGRFAVLPVATSRAVKLGGTVVTVGFPNIGLQGFAPKLAKGEIASLSGAGDDARYFQISVPVQPGNSGGALVDERGNVVGVVSAKLSAKAALAASGSLPENVNYAVKSSYLLSFLESVPEVSAKLKEPETKERKFEDVVKSAEQSAVLVLVY